MSSKRKNNFFLQDIIFIIFSILVAIVLVETEVLYRFLVMTRELHFIGSFLSGMFFTSIFTTAPAIVTLGEIARQDSVFLTALFGAMGAAVGDLIIFQFIKNRFSEHLLGLIEHKGSWKRFKALFHLSYFRWFTFLLGGLIIASPFPDELGIGLLGFTRVKASTFIYISFFFNFVGILVIGSIARAF